MTSRDTETRSRPIYTRASGGGCRAGHVFLYPFYPTPALPNHVPANLLGFFLFFFTFTSTIRSTFNFDSRAHRSSRRTCFEYFTPHPSDSSRLFRLPAMASEKPQFSSPPALPTTALTAFLPTPYSSNTVF